MQLSEVDELLKYFDGGYLINLPHREDRLRSAERELRRIGWCLSDTAIHLYPARIFGDSAGFPTIGARGCFDSHLQCLKRAIASGKRHALILEDDIAITSSLPSLSSSILAQLEINRWDFVYLGHELTGDIARAGSKTKSVNLIPSQQAEILTTHFYAINGRILNRLISYLEQISAFGDDHSHAMPIDGAYNIFRRQNSDVRMLLADPKLGWQRPSRSDIASRKFFDRPALDFLTAPIREWKNLADRWRL